VATTPGRLALIAAALTCASVLFGFAGLAAERLRSDAVSGARTGTEPLLGVAVSLYASLADADATATSTFLTGGLEPAARRARYRADLVVAGGSLTTLARASASPAARRAVGVIADRLPVYAGLIETARTENRRGLPVGAAYLRQASALLQGGALPAARDLYALAAGGLAVDYRSGTGSGALILAAVAAVAWLASLLLVQRHLARISRRVLNLALIAATVIELVLSVWLLIALGVQQSALARAQRQGSDPVEILSATRILAARAQSDESLTLAARGGDAQHAADFDAVARLLAGRGFTIGGGGGWAERVDTALDRRMAIAQGRFAAASGDAHGVLTGLDAAIPSLTLVVALLALGGIWQRLREYQ
jgi:hypothetical protein